MSTEELATLPPPVVRHELTVPEVLAQAEKIKQVMAQAMEEHVHYGRIPGTPKPTLFKAGAEKLCLLFRLDPEYESIETPDGEHRTIKSRCTLFHIPTGQRFGSGEGSCSTKESKYAYRKRGGDRTANLDLPDQYNTVLKMANKRALVAAVLNVTAASDIFTQDLEDAEPPAKSPPAPAGVRVTVGETPLPAPPTAPLQEWLEAFERVDNATALVAMWRTVTAADLWSSWGASEQVQITAAKNAAKHRLGIV